MSTKSRACVNCAVCLVNYTVCLTLLQFFGGWGKQGWVGTQGARHTPGVPPAASQHARWSPVHTQGRRALRSRRPTLHGVHPPPAPLLPSPRRQGGRPFRCPAWCGASGGAWRCSAPCSRSACGSTGARAGSGARPWPGWSWCAGSCATAFWAGEDRGGSTRHGHEVTGEGVWGGSDTKAQQGTRQQSAIGTVAMPGC